jgi:membrane protease YdiL (CAAX protease family)
MFAFFWREIKAAGAFVKRNRREVIVLCLAALAITLNEYNPVSPFWLGALVYFGALPLMGILLLGRNPLDFGLRIGNWKSWGFHVILVVVIGLPVLYFASRTARLENYYTIAQFNLLVYSLEITAYMLAWEFFFRGFLLFWLKEKLGEASILVQMVPFVLLHFGKPEVETISAIVMGVYLGFIAYRGKSFWPALIIHLFINITFRVLVNMR